MKGKEFFVGLDIGTDSIGWAVTDLNYNLVKVNGRDYWGTYLFDNAETAVKRRTQRTTRRRYARARHRIKLLQSLFAEEVAKVDPSFFIRLENGSLDVADKNGILKSKYTLFADSDFTDKEYNYNFKSIYHLRNHLISNKVDDIRFLYLAIHHIIKNRGHFLFEGQDFSVSNTSSIVELFSDINNILQEEDKPTFEMDKINEALDVLKRKSQAKSDKQKELMQLFGVSKDDKQLVGCVKAIVGLKTKISALYDIDCEDKDIEFNKSTFDENDLPEIESAVGFDEAELVRKLKAIYDWTVLVNILGDERYISQAKIKIYDKHRNDLAKLKTLVKAFDDENRSLYKKVFKKQDGVTNYAAYIGMDNQRVVKKCKNVSDFYDFLKKLGIPLTDEMLEDIENGNFLPKQVSNANSVIPYQVNVIELKAILNNAAKYFPFLENKKDGTSVIDKIVQLMTFRVPYYVGPLNTDSKFAWAKRNLGYERVSITPWNFDKAIDQDASEEKFIERMTNKCTYLVLEDVLPASSLAYSEFTFLNELNNLKVNGEKSKVAKDLIYNYAKANKKVTLSACLKELKKYGLIEKDAKKEDVFSGIDEEFKKNLAPYVTLKKILGDFVDTNREICEEIIKLITVTSDKSRLEKVLKNRYSSMLTDEQIKLLKSLNFVKWGNLSNKFLQGFYSMQAVDEQGECLSILDIMRREPINLQEVIYKYGFDKELDNYIQENIPNDKINYKTVEKLYCSPSVKRAIWRTIELVREIVKVMGGTPKKVFIEMARGEDEEKKGQKTTSRKQRLINLFSENKEKKDWVEEIKKRKDTEFNSRRLVLYYMQECKCMYSGKYIPIDYIWDKNVCDIEHIYPRSKIKDDSFDNICLVYKTENMMKGDNYPISAEIRAKRISWWRELRSKKLISDKKYERLVRSTELTEDEKTDFINRQLVETRQSTKEVAKLLKRDLGESTEIVYAKAGNANDFKNENELIKVRELNNLHHAKDAYINIVVGNVYNTEFGHDAKVYFKKNMKENYNLKYLFDKDIPNAWRVADKQRIKGVYNKNTCRVVRFTSMGKGELFNATIYPKGENLIPIKENGPLANTTKYGGYKSEKTAYFMLIKGKDKKGKTILLLEPVSIYKDLHFKRDERAKAEFLAKTGLINPQIALDNIKKDTLLSINGSYAYLKGITSGGRFIISSANELVLSEDLAKYLKEISNCFRDKKKYFSKTVPVSDKISAERNLELYNAFIEKLSLPIYAGIGLDNVGNTLQEKIDKFTSLSLDNQLTILFEIIKILQCNSTCGDLTLIEGAKSAGKLVQSGKIQDKNVKIIMQSPTGRYRRVIDCNTLL